MKYDYDLIVIGGGAAGLTASTFAGQSGAKTLLIEKEEKLGGDCLHFGCVPSKTLIKSGYAYNVIRQAEKYGLPKMKMPPVDFVKVRNRIWDVIGVIQKHDEPSYLKSKFNVDTRFGRPRFINNHTIVLDDMEITSRYFILATGSSAYIPQIEGLKETSYVTNKEIFSLDQLPKSLIVLGGGPNGMEMAQAFARLGSKVTVIQFADRLLGNEDEDIAEFVKHRLELEGVNICLNARAVRVAQKEDRSIKLTIRQEDKQWTIRGDTLLLATGRHANIDGLDLEKAGVQYAPKGIKVDNRLRTTARNIFTCGDATGYLKFTHVASYEAVVAVYNAILKIPKKADYTNVPWCTYLDPEVASIGYNEQRAKKAGIKYTAHIDYFAENDRALAESETKGFIKILINTRGKVIGVQIVGFHAGDLIHEWVPVLNGKVSLNTLSNAMHAYPTMAEINKNSAINYLVSTIPPWVKKVTKFLFGYQGKV